MAKQLDISSFFFKKPARAPSLARQDEEAPAATEAGMKRKTPTERHATRDDDVITFIVARSRKGGEDVRPRGRQRRASDRVPGVR
jgi:hypothetical protein